MATTADREASDGTLEGRDPELLRRLYELMVHMRSVADRMVAMDRSGDDMLGSLYSGHRHEAISVGAASCLRADDHMAPLHPKLGNHLWKGMEPWQIMASFVGKATATSPTGGRDGTLHYGRLDLAMYNPPSHVPANFPAATWSAFAATYRGLDRVCLAFCGDGSTSRGDFHESLTIASAPKLTDVFVIENNQYSYSTPLRPTSNSESFAIKAVAYGIPGVKVDGTDGPAASGRRAVAAGPPWRGPVDRRGSSRGCTATPSTTRPTTYRRSCTRSTRRTTRWSCSRTCWSRWACLTRTPRRRLAGGHRGPPHGARRPDARTE